MASHVKDIPVMVRLAFCSLAALQIFLALDTVLPMEGAQIDTAMLLYLNWLIEIDQVIADSLIAQSRTSKGTTRMAHSTI